MDIDSICPSDMLVVLVDHFEDTGLNWPTNDQINSAPDMTMDDLIDTSIHIDNSIDAIAWKASELKMLLRS